MTPRRLPALYHQIVFVGVVSLLASCCLQAHLHNERERMQTALLARTRARIVGEIEPLCRALLPAEDTLTFQIAPQQMHDRNNGARNNYSVECFDGRGRQRLYLLWDEDARRPYSISVVPTGAHSHSPRLKAITAGQSVGIAWMCRLGLVSAQEARGGHVRLEGGASVEVARLYLPGRMVMTWTNRRSGELWQIQITAQPQPAAPKL